ncbi:hypothetical protein FJ365_03740 [Candidatus Dependentiae bacterium]|nr:hypothetical protein [Candidatus Dependentiae bacterium]
MIHIFEESQEESRNDATSTAPDIQVPPAEEEAATRQKLYDEVTHQINTTPLQGELKIQLARAVALLQDLKQEIEGKKSGALAKRQLIREKVTALCDSGKVNVDQSEFDKSDVSVHEFVGLLDRMVEEVDADYQFYKQLVSDTPPPKMLVFKVEHGTFEEVVKQRIEMIKRYVKTAKRDLAVSYSRYCYGFEAQIRQILFVEQVLMRKGSAQ